MFRKKFLSLFIIILLLGSLGSSYYFYTKYQNAQAVLNNPEAVAKKDIAKITKKLSTHMMLPTDEEPNIATVLDVEKLKDQSFFRQAQNGDKVILYPKSQKAILYRESIDRIIEISPISLPSPSPSPSSK